MARFFSFLAGLLISISEAIDKRWPGGETDKGDDTDEWLKPISREDRTDQTLTR